MVLKLYLYKTAYFHFGGWGGSGHTRLMLDAQRLFLAKSSEIIPGMGGGDQIHTPDFIPSLFYMEMG